MTSAKSTGIRTSQATENKIATMEAGGSAVERYVDTPNGRIFVREVPGEDPPIVLMHGFPDDHRIYDKLQLRLFPRRSVAFDWPGYGHSDRLDTAGFSPEAHGADLAAVMDALGISSAVLVGHDASGPDGVAFTVAHPERVAHLALLNTVSGHQPSLRLPEMIRLLADPALTPLADAMIHDEGQRLWLLQHTAAQWEMDALDPEGIAVQSILPQFFGGANQPDALVAIRAWTAGLFDVLDAQDALVKNGALRDLGVPVSIIFGEMDRYLNPSLAREIAAIFENPSFHLVSGASHWPQQDQPDRVAELLKGLGTE